MAKKIGKIAVIGKETSSSGIQTMETSLLQKGMSRLPGTSVIKFPYKEMDGRYRTGLDENAAYIKRIEDLESREAEIERVKALKLRLENMLGFDLSERSDYWNSSKLKSLTDTSHVSPAKLIDGVNIYDLNDPLNELTFSWLRVHPTIASSYAAYERGEYPADTQFYVVDEEIESAIAYKKKKSVNSAIIKFNGMTISKQRKVARLLGLPITEETKEEIVYNTVDTLLKEQEISSGSFKGMNPITVFEKFANMKENLIHVKDVIEQALQHTIYRERPNGRIYEGELEVSESKEELAKFLVADENQSDLFTLEGKIKVKKVAPQTV